MFLEGRAVNQYIVEKDNDALPEQWLEGLVHSTLKNVGSSSQAEGHDSILKLSPMGLKCYFEFFTGCQADLI